MGKLWEQIYCLELNRQMSYCKLGIPLHPVSKDVEFLSFKIKSETSIFQQGTAQPYFVIIEVCDTFKETIQTSEPFVNGSLSSHLCFALILI